MDSGNHLSAVELSSSDPSATQTSSGKAVSNTIPIQTPPLTVMMQQAVAMQQFQFQQALLMQQVMAAQQAAARAATLKSATEMAAARAAEISKQLKGSDVEEEKPFEGSKSRSRSKSASRSPSPSRSKSRSRSPIRYRRGRSTSRSPIRYRRDYYSPSRTRDYYGYRSRGYRGYYRGGRNDYSWNMYRRGRDRDYHFRSSRRSRSRGRRRSRTKSRSPRRSRSRGRKRSGTLSHSPRRSRRSHTRSPRHHREKSSSPKRKREERKSNRSSRRSVSREPKRSPSVSSRSISASLARKEGSRSPSNVDEDRSDNMGNVHSPSKEEKTSARKVSCSPSQAEVSGPLNEERSVGMSRKGNNRASPAKTRSSSSPARSLSVSVEYKRSEKAASHDDLQPRSLVHECDPVQDSEPDRRVDMSDEAHKKQKNLNKEAPVEDANSKGSNSDEDYPFHKSNIGKNSPVDEISGRKLTGASKAAFDEESESEYDEVLDDWRDDLKVSTKEKGNATYGSREMEKKSEKWGRINSVSEVQRLDLIHTGQNKQSDSSLNHKKVQGDASSEEESNDNRLQGGKLEQNAVPERDGDASLSLSEDRGEQGFGERIHVGGVAEDVDEQGKDEDTECKEDGRQYDEDAIFEGPRPASEEHEERIERVDSGRADCEAYSLEKRHIITSDQKRIFELRAQRDSEEDDSGGREMAGSIDREEDKVRDRSRPKDAKKHEDDPGRCDKRRDRHKKHKKKHRHEDSDLEKDDGYGEKKDDGDAHRGRRRHKRKHKKDGEHENKERKRRKHKHRVKSSSESPEESLLADADEGRGDEDRSAARKKSSKRHKKSKRDVSESPSPSATSSD